MIRARLFQTIEVRCDPRRFIVRNLVPVPENPSEDQNLVDSHWDKRSMYSQFYGSLQRRKRLVDLLKSEDELME